MSTEENKAVVRRYLEEGSRDESVFKQVTHSNVVAHFPGLPQPVRGLEGLLQLNRVYHTGFPDLNIKIEDMVAEGNKVVARYVIRATHQGDFQGIPPTGKQITVAGMSLFHLEGGKVAEEWDSFDAMGMMQQLGVIPAPGQGGS
jgi:steroid delta-isomerase-like uncharacterized protein